MDRFPDDIRAPSPLAGQGQQAEIQSIYRKRDLRETITVALRKSNYKHARVHPSMSLILPELAQIKHELNALGFLVRPDFVNGEEFIVVEPGLYQRQQDPPQKPEASV